MKETGKFSMEEENPPLKISDDMIKSSKIIADSLVNSCRKK
jgi:hypothetical protein